MTDRAVRRIRRDVDTSPFLIIWEVTRACDLACAHCRADAIHDAHPLQLTTDQGRELLDEMARFGPPMPLVVLTGGDPFKRDDLPELVAHGRSLGLGMAIAPSVTPRADRAAFERVRAAGAKAVSLSLDGPDAATHDAFRGVEGVFDATLETAKVVRDVGFRLQVNSTVTRTNLDVLPELLEQVLDLDAFLWSVFFLVETGRGSTLAAVDPRDGEDVLHWLADVARYLPVKTTEAPHFRRVVMQRRGHDGDVAADFGLGETYRRLRAALDDTVARRGLDTRRPRPPLDINAGRGFVFIDHIGIVQPSGFLPLPVGSVRERSLVDVYRQAPVLRALRDPDGFSGRCGVCEYRHVCGGSRSRAFALGGDPLGEDPSCVHVPAALG
jgi:radical SAM protein